MEETFLEVLSEEVDQKLKNLSADISILEEMLKEMKSELSVLDNNMVEQKGEEEQVGQLELAVGVPTNKKGSKLGEKRGPYKTRKAKAVPELTIYKLEPELPLANLKVGEAFNVSTKTLSNYHVQNKVYGYNKALGWVLNTYHDKKAGVTVVSRSK